MKHATNNIQLTGNTSYRLISLEETDSTNSFLARLCGHGEDRVEEFTTVSAEYQTSGRGQRGNSWESERGKNLTFSFVLRPTFLCACRQFVLSQIAALSVKEELEQHAGNISIKWPNDIYWNEKKICGMLIENDLAEGHIARSIIGIGINVNQGAFGSDAPNPVSLKQITGSEHDCHKLLDGIMTRVIDYYCSLRAGNPMNVSSEIVMRYTSSLFRSEGMHPYADAEGNFLASIVKVEPDGRLVLRDGDGRLREYMFKEVQYIL